MFRYHTLEYELHLISITIYDCIHTVIDIKDFIKLFKISKHMQLNIAQYNEEMHFY